MKIISRLAWAVAAAALSGLSNAQTFYTPGGTVSSSANANVGIGTSTPAVKLELLGPACASPALSGTNQPGASVRFGNIQTNGVLDIGVNSAAGAWLQYTSRTDLSVNYPILLNPNGGPVGVGSLSPGAKLEVSAASNGAAVSTGTSQPNASLRLGNNQTNGILDIGINSGSGAWFQYTNRSDLSLVYPILLNPNGGNVGIGTTNPTQKLSVNGTVRAKEVIVETTGWSDYVFAKGYALASLSEVERQIAQEGHLPGIPSAQEVSEKGISLGEMQTKLLAKIEEITLRQIAQEKEISELRTQNIALEKEVKAGHSAQ